MDINVKKKTIAVKEAAAKLTKQGYRVNGSAAPVEQFADFAMMKLLIFMSLCDKSANASEAMYINEFFGKSFSGADIERMSRSVDASANGVTDAMLRVCAAFAAAERDGALQDGSSLLIGAVNDLGLDFIACDGKADDRESEFLGRLIFRMKNFCKTYMETAPMLGARPKQPQESTAPEPEAPAKPTEPAEPEKTLDELLDELNALVGLENVKSEIYSLSNLIKVRKLREERGFKQPKISLHLVFTGNPGTGKTTVARLLAGIYNRLGAISTDKLVEVDRSGLVSGYVGQTATKTRQVCESALGGVLFIDEAYSLTANVGQNDFGMEAVDTVLKFMEDNRDDFVVICAGYTELMEEFLSSNPGLRSRFNKFIEFKDYTADELTEIFVLRCKSYNLEIESEAVECARTFFEQRCKNKPESFANARDARNYFERVISRQADRLAPIEAPTDHQLMTITVEDVVGVILT